jgi:hypothetical protein
MYAVWPRPKEIFAQQFVLPPGFTLLDHVLRPLRHILFVRHENTPNIRLQIVQTNDPNLPLHEHKFVWKTNPRDSHRVVL